MRKNVKKNSSINIEHIIIGDSYKLSLNPATQPVSTRTLSKWYDNFVCPIDGIANKNKIVLFLESSPIGRYHFHGIIEINDIPEWLKLLKYIDLTATMDMDYIDDETYWFNYCIKQDIYFEKLIIRYPYHNMSLASAQTETITFTVSTHDAPRHEGIYEIAIKGM